MKNKNIISIILIGLYLIFNSCEEKNITPVKVSFNIPSLGYVIYIGDTIDIKPNIVSPDEVSHKWLEDEIIISEDASLKYTSTKVGMHIITYIATNSSGDTETSINIEVKDVNKPKITITKPENGFSIKQDKPLTIVAEVESLKECTYTWKEGEKILSKEKALNFSSIILGKHTITFQANNIGGITEEVINIEVVSVAKPTVTFENNINVIYTSKGKNILIKPNVESEVDVTYQWTLNGEELSTTKDYSFQVNKNGLFKLILHTTNAGGCSTHELKIIAGCRVPNETSSLLVNKVYEYKPAPGQFINESVDLISMKEANTQALEWINEKDKFVTLGGFGGYVIFGFDHSIIDKEGKDIMIMGNSFTGPSGNSCEPGIVSVMQDENGNGIPDDTWYELKGENYDDPTTIKDYEVTYYRPTEPEQDVQWTDNKGNKGCIDYMGDFHYQDYYYPLWIKEDSYTLKGTRLKDRTVQDPITGFWSNKPFGDGYVDNYVLQDGEKADEIHYENEYGGNKFEINNAIDKNGKKVELGYVDFIKVHNAVNVKAGWLGENSTEIYQVSDIKSDK